ncbi:hypothetical protein [Sporomusa acidovorans]|uniref:Uncharacterized protein n=1 Tax=Sporomusa acidovorans (strain ATCC 49682 / DSM 3132 / Mol) TaxID=1123286 RepID=A0ABZ3J0F6_SPOA4|nr:hypothetical protein [Sporomusa acidovorans]OZC21970.1 hypothetical protein SPACI_16530 [Sporomusa acidovorans DSM 3132]SDF65190.1 hypothetical protein SAMN04488499_106524 [Sporomusa acidovorans]
MRNQMSASIQQITANANQVADNSAQAAGKVKNGDKAVENSSSSDEANRSNSHNISPGCMLLALKLMPIMSEEKPTELLRRWEKRFIVGELLLSGISELRTKPETLSVLPDVLWVYFLNRIKKWYCTQINCEQYHRFFIRQMIDVSVLHNS